MAYSNNLLESIQSNSSKFNGLSATELQSCNEEAHRTIIAAEKTTDALSSILTALYIESARNDFPIDFIECSLNSCHIQQSISTQLIQHYKESYNEYRDILSRIGWHPPTIVDCQWKLSQKITSSYVADARNPVFTIDLNNVKTGSKQVSHFQFQCTAEKLQDLVWKLKEAAKAAEKISKGESHEK